MRIGLISNSILSAPVAGYLKQQGMLCGLGAPASNQVVCKQFDSWARSERIPFTSIQKISQEDLLLHWIDHCQPDAVFVLTFPYLIPASVLSLPKIGFLNFHPGPLPAYRGPDPLFWQILHGNSDSALTVHRMDDQFDTGPIILSHPFHFGEGATYRMAIHSFFDAASQILPELVELIQRVEIPEKAQPDNFGSFDPLPSIDDVTIDWDLMTATQIQHLARATNPDRGGAITWLRGTQIKIVEARTIDIDHTPKLSPGTIISANAGRGLQIITRDEQCLEVMVATNAEGIYSGDHLCRLFDITIGERMGTLAQDPILVG